MQNKKFISPLVVGFAAGILSIVPVIKSLGCCLLIPVAAFLSLMLDQKANKNFSKLEIKKGVIFGLVTGLTAAFFGTFFDFLITLITQTNDLVYAFPQLLETINQFPVDEATKQEVLALLGGVIEDIKTNGFSLLYTLSLLANNLFSNSVFGILGGIIGVQILNSRNQQK
ncbi:MAG: hypothetical protein PF445_10995 [Melioribacteraceae bacterium]|jgi:hypothetical protein|nr:hypothetical protein [Melioribacteraceae bacterium]